jgi:hypothetical protein
MRADSSTAVRPHAAPDSLSTTPGRAAAARAAAAAPCTMRASGESAHAAAALLLLGESALAAASPASRRGAARVLSAEAFSERRGGGHAKSLRKPVDATPKKQCTRLPIFRSCVIRHGGAPRAIQLTSTCSTLLPLARHCWSLDYPARCCEQPQPISAARRRWPTPQC